MGIDPPMLAVPEAYGLTLFNRSSIFSATFVFSLIITSNSVMSASRRCTLPANPSIPFDTSSIP
ncbi:hypothetical protein AUG19_09355 [archaeon 13_1_20CM_2_54_9]|nr:MAG: hypothetical protein AUJ07_08385 [Crenarchaeota archaeon 13_1_40CM_3_53_5]OLE74311.1 MAG: hypothetical protein AUG19_09355 [archaeon 13_1_20CM_2_54_9]